MMFAAATAAALSSAAAETRFERPWKSADHAIVVDGYEFNELDLSAIASDKRVAAFINKGSDGLPPKWSCKSGTQTEQDLCKNEWRLYAVSKELYHTRRALAKAMGLKWGAYHLGRPGNPIDQANHFIDFAEPEPDDLIAIDIEDTASGKYISLADAEEFARHINRRLGRYPVLYVNEDTAKKIAAQRHDYPLLSRLTLWYARYQPEIASSFPKGNWDSYSLWQFASHLNCGKRACPHRVEGAGSDIDLNVASMDVKSLKAAWPLGELLPFKDPKTSIELSRWLVAAASNDLRDTFDRISQPMLTGFGQVADAAAAPEIDPVVTASIAYDRPRGQAD